MCPDSISEAILQMPCSGGRQPGPTEVQGGGERILFCQCQEGMSDPSWGPTCCCQGAEGTLSPCWRAES